MRDMTGEGECGGDMTGEGEDMTGLLPERNILSNYFTDHHSPQWIQPRREDTDTNLRTLLLGLIQVSILHTPTHPSLVMSPPPVMAPPHSPSPVMAPPTLPSSHVSPTLPSPDMSPHTPSHQSYLPLTWYVY